MYPAVQKYGDIEMESFEKYYGRWPTELQTIPREVVKDWIYRHWTVFQNHWIGLKPHLWSYRCASFSNEDIVSINHIGTWIPELDAEGVEYVSGAPRSRTPLAQYMLSRGTFPVPIIVAESAGNVVYPHSGGELMKEPYQLIEGHNRLACIRGMINSQHSNLASSHSVWVVSIPEAASGA